MASSKETYCLCGQPYNIGQFMIECDCCREWFHGSCVDVKIYQSDDIDKYHCPKCAQTYGPSVLKIPTNNHRADRYELGAETRASQIGTPAWVRALAARPLRPVASAVQKLRGHEFTEETVRDNAFTRPVLFSSTEGLDLKVPNPATFTVRSVLRFCGAQLEVEVIDVRKQATLRMPLGDFVEYFETPPEHRDEKVLNVLSLEFSDTNMSQLVEPPLLARTLDWATQVWSSEEPPRPAVQKYCLMSAAGAYTDFHVDFGGTTVWYHVLHGRKIFYLIPPTSTNLALYQQWSASNNQTEKFFGDMVEWYGTVELQAGQSLFIPTGWIHAVLTPCDALVFGGNFLHSYAIEMQLQIYEIERRVETPLMFRYPLFEAMHWHAGAALLSLLRRHNDETMDEDFTLSESLTSCGPPPIPPLLLRGAKILANALKEWHALKTTDQSKRDNVPKCLNSAQLVRELCKELRTLEKRSASTANKDKDVKGRNTSPTKAHARKQSNTQKKSLKLTLPKPIMHHANGEFVDEKIYADKFYIDNKEIVYENYLQTDTKYNILPDPKYNGLPNPKYNGLSDPKYNLPDPKYNGLPDTKYVVENDIVLPEKYTFQPPYEEQIVYTDGNNYLETHDKKTLKIKMTNSPSSSQDPPPYHLPEHSILKSHLSRSDPAVRAGQHITKTYMSVPIKQHHTGMYPPDGLQPDYQYVPEPKQEYLYNAVGYVQPRYAEIPAGQSATYTEMTVPAHITNGFPAHLTAELATDLTQDLTQDQITQDHLPSYDAAIAQHYAPGNYVIQEQKPLPPAPRPRRSERPPRRRLSTSYDYSDCEPHDMPARARHKPKSTNFRQAAPRQAPANGIESLIQASVLAEEEPAMDTEDAAVEGMLSIGTSRFSTQRTFGLATDTKPTTAAGKESSSSSRSTKRPRRITAPLSSGDEEEEDVIKEVHRDDEYVYPSLEMSSDDEEEWSNTRRRRSRARTDSRTRNDKDGAWSPRARLGRLVPRLRGPARAGVRREAVRAALQAAHAAPRRATPPNAKRAVLATKNRRPPPPTPATIKNQKQPVSDNSRLKKGMKTAKQRLGKILKIHKMIY